MSDMEEIKSDVKLLLANQMLIKTQVVKTNGRVTFLERVFWMVFGGATLFMFFFKDKIIEVLIK